MPLRLLVSLIRGARATLFPSLYEGFGLPVLESMLLGTPVLTSTAGSLPEVAGDAALVVDPYDVDAIRDGIRTLDADEALRDDLSARGRQQAAKFSPERYQERLADAYRPFV
jgi:glycosyltransferase involved in cell wall biosynthesis